MNLIKGQRIKLFDAQHKPTIQAKVHVNGLREPVSFLCVALNAQEKAIDQRYVISARTPQSPDNSITAQDLAATQGSFEIRLASLPENVKELVFAISMGENTGTLLDNASDIREGSLALFEGGRELARYTFSAQDFEGEKTVVLGKLYFKDGWRLGVVSSGFRAGLVHFTEQFGIAMETVRPQQAPTPSGTNTQPAPQDGGSSGPGIRLSKMVLPTAWPGGRQPSIPQDMVSAAGLLLVERADGSHATGSGFAVTPGGHILSCYHVIEHAKTINIAMESTDVWRPVVLLAGDAEHDIALLWIADGNGTPHWMLLAPPEENPGLGEPLGLLAYPLGFHLGMGITYSQGIVNSHRRRQNVPLFQIDAGAAPGSSGGPVFRRSDGRVVGMLQGGLTSEDRGIIINLALNMRAFWGLGWTV